MPDLTCVHGSVDQCLICSFYVIDGQKINYREIKNFGATTESEIKFLEHIKRQSVTAFFHQGEMYIPSRQGRSVPLAIGLQWRIWQARQAVIDELQIENNRLSRLIESNLAISKDLQQMTSELIKERDELKKQVEAVQ